MIILLEAGSEEGVHTSVYRLRTFDMQSKISFRVPSRVDLVSC